MCTGTYLNFWCPCTDLTHTWQFHPEEHGHRIVRVLNFGAYMWCTEYLQSPEFSFTGQGVPPCDDLWHDQMNFRSTTLCDECVKKGCRVEWEKRSMYGHRSQKERALYRAAAVSARLKSRQAETPVKSTPPPSPPLRSVDEEAIMSLRPASATPSAQTRQKKNKKRLAQHMNQEGKTKEADKPSPPTKPKTTNTKGQLFAQLMDLAGRKKEGEKSSRTEKNKKKRRTKKESIMSQIRQLCRPSSTTETEAALVELDELATAATRDNEPACALEMVNVHAGLGERPGSPASVRSVDSDSSDDSTISAASVASDLSTASTVKPASVCEVAAAVVSPDLLLDAVVEECAKRENEARGR
ncbi:3101f125-5078-4178-bb54-3ededee31d0d [Thermothielavioides terrestris]|uniref:3101f125-5078-4178-bb54-3ededee31d0d n=1 Tax=Thermothielavioides terrestris TaxID=2587410 RepID=A0A446BLG6_9PEZI|nr:3101f125-5078-4178-bb54-3ededee31d0d [Thermothielavioides terrestris]